MLRVGEERLERPGAGTDQAVTVRGGADNPISLDAKNRANGIASRSRRSIAAAVGRSFWSGRGHSAIGEFSPAAG